MAKIMCAECGHAADIHASTTNLLGGGCVVSGCSCKRYRDDIIGENQDTAEFAYLVTEAQRKAIDQAYTRALAMNVSYQKAMSNMSQRLKEYMAHIEWQNKQIIELSDEIRMLLQIQSERIERDGSQGHS